MAEITIAIIFITFMIEYNCKKGKGRCSYEQKSRKDNFPSSLSGACPFSNDSGETGDGKEENQLEPEKSDGYCWEAD